MKINDGATANIACVLLHTDVNFKHLACILQSNETKKLDSQEGPRVDREKRISDRRRNMIECYGEIRGKVEYEDKMGSG